MTYPPIVNNSIHPTQSVQDRELQAIKEIAASLGGAVKNYALYPKGHSFARKYLATIQRQLTSFLDTYETLPFSIRKGTLLYGEEIVYSGDDEENNVAFLFSRDGIEELEFFRGLDAAELESFLDIINTYRIADEDTNGDIITALWEREYPHIQYKTVDILSLEAPSFSFAGLSVSGDPGSNIKADEDNGYSKESGLTDDGSTTEGTKGDFENPISTDEDEDQLESSTETSGVPISIALTADNDLWSLTPMERDQLQTMVDDEEYGDNTDSVIETLLISLVVQKSANDFGAVLDFLQERYMHTLKTGNFRLSLKVLRNIKGLYAKYLQKKSWTIPLFDEFFSAVSKPEALRDIERFLMKKKSGFGDDRTEYLWSSLRLLNPEILAVIGPLAGNIPLDELRRELYEVVSYHARNSPETLAKVLDQCDEEIIMNLIPMVELMMETDAGRILTRMALHPAVRVRGEAFRILSSRNQLELTQLFPLIDDPNEAIRQKMFFHLGKKRDRRIETLFHDYLQNRKYKQDDVNHLATCYRTLGRCGSAASIPFLQKILMDRNISHMIGIGSSVHKEGAAGALRALRLKKAVAILQDGAKSVRPDIRFACRKAISGKGGKK